MPEGLCATSVTATRHEASCSRRLRARIRGFRPGETPRPRRGRELDGRARGCASRIRHLFNPFEASIQAGRPVGIRYPTMGYLHQRKARVDLEFELNLMSSFAWLAGPTGRASPWSNVYRTTIRSNGKLPPTSTWPVLYEVEQFRAFIAGGGVVRLGLEPEVFPVLCHDYLSGWLVRYIPRF